MAATDAALNSGFSAFKPQLGNKLLLIAGIAAVVAVMVVVWLWSKQPDYRVLFANYSDKDGGAIVASLEQMNVPYKFSEGGSSILVPAAQVHEMRLKLASQGLPKGGNIGFELLENQKFGVSQFVEQVNFQRALEGELERSIQSIDAVQTARIHLAIPKPSVFVRDQQKPSASVLLNLHPGRSLNPQQVSAIVHLVASSISELAPANVTIVDQNGTLLTDDGKKKNGNNLDPSQLKYVEELQQNIASRVEAIIAPILGAQNVHAEASAEVDFSVQEQAAEIYTPNQDPKVSAVRSMQSSESQNGTVSAGGIPGAQSNQPQPPAPATAPIEAGAVAAADGSAAPATTPISTQKNVTTNYEVDKTVRYTQQPMGGVKRLTVAVVVNDKHTLDKNGKPVSRPLNDAEKKQIEQLAKQAMGFSEQRGDSLSIVNSSFIVPTEEVLPPIPVWKQDANIALAKDILKLAAGLLVMFLLYRRLLKPMTQKLVQLQPDTKLLPTGNLQDDVVSLSSQTAASLPQPLQVRGYQQNLESAKQLAKENPRMVASVVTNWVGSND